MTQLLSIEWRKLRYYRTFWILTIMFAGLLTLFYLSIGLGWMDVGANGINLISKASSFAAVWDDLCFFTSYFIIALAILTVIITTNEFQYRTNRQNIIDGWTRMQFYHVKWLMVLSISLATTVFTFILGVLVGIIGGLPLSTVFDNAEKLLYLFLLNINYLGFALTLSFFFKRSGLTIGILMFYSMIIETILHALIVFKYKFPLGDLFLPLQCSDELLPSTPSKLLKIAMKSALNPETWTYVVVTIGWIILYYFIGKRKMAKSDW